MRNYMLFLAIFQKHWILCVNLRNRSN